VADIRSSFAGRAGVGAGARAGTATLLGQVMFLVGVALAFATLGTVIGHDLSGGAALGCFLGGVGMLFVQGWLGERFRVGAIAIGWLYTAALLIGLGLGPSLGYLIENDPTVVTQAAGSTALIVVGMGALGFSLSKDLAAWMRPLSIIVFIAVIVSFVLLIAGSGGNPILSIIIGGISAALITVYFNYLRKHATEDDAVWLATGIFVGIVNIFLSALNIFDN